MSEFDLQPYLDDYAAVTGQTTDEFICPITLEPVACGEVIAGHIFPESAPGGSQAILPQWKRVDNDFGHLAEDEFIRFAQLMQPTRKRYIDLADKLTAIDLNDNHHPVFWSSPRSRPPFLQVTIRDEDDRELAQPYIKTQDAALFADDRIEVEGFVSIPELPVVVSAIKIAHLTLFKWFGYRWVYSVSGLGIQSALSAFIRDHESNETARLFDPYRRALRFVRPDSVLGSQCSIDEGVFWLHYESPRLRSDHFSISIIIPLHMASLVVSLPDSAAMQHGLKSSILYQIAINGIARSWPTRRGPNKGTFNFFASVGTVGVASSCSSWWGLKRARLCTHGYTRLRDLIC